MARVVPTAATTTALVPVRAAPAVTSVVAPMVTPLVDWNPMDWLGDQAREGMADAWTAAMISLWSAGMWLLGAVFQILDRFLTPDLRDPGLAHLYGVTLWVSLVVALAVGLSQIGLAAIRRDGTSLGTLAVGIAQYGAVVTCWLALLMGLVVACAGLTTGLLDVLLDIDDFSGFQAGAGWPDRVGGTVAATALGMCSVLLLIPAGIGFVMIMLVREAALLILAATLPIAAAGALGDGTKAWLWKSIRWFLSACLTAPLLALVLGLGVQITRAAFPDTPDSSGGAGARVGDATGAATPIMSSALARSAAGHLSASDQSSQVGMAVVGCVIMVIGCFCPMVLFRLLAFVDPGTGSGASFRSAMSANGGVSGLLSGRSGASQDSGAATQGAPDGRAASEASADAETANRFQSKTAALIGPAGGVVAGGMKAVGSIAQHGASLGVDIMGQGGFGSGGYYDTSSGRGGRVPRQVKHHGSGPTSPADDLADTTVGRDAPPTDLSEPHPSRYGGQPATAGGVGPADRAWYEPATHQPGGDEEAWAGDVSADAGVAHLPRRPAAPGGGQSDGGDAVAKVAGIGEVAGGAGEIGLLP